MARRDTETRAEKEIGVLCRAPRVLKRNEITYCEQSRDPGGELAGRRGRRPPDPLGRRRGPQTARTRFLRPHTSQRACSARPERGCRIAPPATPTCGPGSPRPPQRRPPAQPPAAGPSKKAKAPAHERGLRLGPCPGHRPGRTLQNYAINLRSGRNHRIRRYGRLRRMRAIRPG
jgi:hypothetical protein